MNELTEERIIKEVEAFLAEKYRRSLAKPPAKPTWAAGADKDLLFACSVAFGSIALGVLIAQMMG